jgi:hypothetical protein
MERKPQRQPKKKLTVNRKPAFLAAFRATCRVCDAAKVAGIDVSLHHRWMREDPQYRADFLESRDIAAQRLEDEAVRRGCDGVKKTLYYRGKPIHVGKTRAHAHEVEYSDQLLLATLRRLNPEWRERVDTHVSGSLDLVELLHDGRKRLLEMKRNDSDIAS